jgi:putative DNA primase/helicase
MFERKIEEKLKLAQAKQPHPPENSTDLGNGRRFEALHSGKSLYSKQRNKWILWTGNYWRWDETGEIFDLATTVIQSIYAEAAAHPDKDMREALSNHAIKSEARGKIDNMLAVAQALPTIRTDLERFDHDIWSFGCQDSTIDLSTGQNRPPRREDYISMRSAVKYDPQATCPRWLKFIEEVTQGDSELGSFLQRCAGYSLMGDDSEQCFFLLYGTGGNGKGTFVNILLEMMGDYGGQVKTEVLLENRFEQKDYHLAELAGKKDS